MFSSIKFYNHFGNGDVFESREFVRHLMEIIPAEEYIYYTNKSPRILMDILTLQVSNKFEKEMQADKFWTIKDNILYINTWIGRDSKYVLPGSGCTIEMLYKMYNDLLEELGYTERLRDNVLTYLTWFGYGMYDIWDIIPFIESFKSKKVFISNGIVTSNQAENFDMSELISNLADKFQNIIFLVTSPLEESFTRSNIIDANTLIKDKQDSNLVELSFLSTFCDLIIGRNSGPQVFSWTKNNCLGGNKINITLTRKETCSHFVHSTPINMKKYWTDSTQINALTKFISDVIKGELFND